MSENVRTHKNLKIWQRSIAMVTQVYKLTETFPKSEVFGLINQIRRASVSVPSNIAEGAGRNSHKEFNQFLHIALGSAAELETQFLIAKNLCYISQIQYMQIEQELQEIIRMISALTKTLTKDNSEQKQITTRNL